MTVHDIRDQMANYNVYKDWARKESVERIVIHHSGAGTVWLNGLPNISLKGMAEEHVEDEGRAHVSYHYAINREGKVFYLLDEKIPGYHAALPEPSDAAGQQRWLTQWQAGQYFNRRSVSILVLGWFDENRQQNGQSLPNGETTAPSELQWNALLELLKTIRQRHDVAVSHVQGHGEVLREAGFGNTTCPGSRFDMAQLRAALGDVTVPQPALPQTRLPAISFAESENQLIVNGLAPSLKFPLGNPRWYYASSALIPSTLSPDIELDFPVALGNGGQSDWLRDGSERTSVAIKWIDANNREVGQTIWSRLPYNLLPGQRADFRMKIKTPTTPGSYRLHLSLYHSGYQKWFHQLDSSTAPDYFPTTVSRTRTLEEPSEVEDSTRLSPVVAVAYRASCPVQMLVGMQRELAVELHNQGTEVWLAEGAHPIMVSHQWFNQAGYLVQPTLRTLLPRDVLPNEKLIVTISLLSPPEVGTYRLQVDMVQEGHFFFSQRGNAPLTAQIEVNVAESTPTWAAQWNNMELPAPLFSGEETRMELQVRNLGQNRWAADTIRLAYCWNDGPAYRVELPIDILPGSEIAFGIPLILPEERGTYTLRLDLWEKENGWLEVGYELKGLILLPCKEHLVPADELVIVSPLEEEPAFALEQDVLIDEGIEERTEESPEEEIRALVSEEKAGEEVVTLSNRTIKASASHNPERAKYAVDRHKVTAWSSGESQQPGMWFQLDLGQNYFVHRLRFVSQAERFPRGYIMEGSQDGERWQELHRVSENWADIHQILPVPTQMRYVRITQSRQNPWGEEWSIRDVQIEVLFQGGASPKAAD